MSMLSAGRVVARGGGAAFAEAADVGQVDVGHVQNFWRRVERMPVGASISGPENAKRQIVVVSGWLTETQILPDGRRQIFTFLLPGDVACVGGSSHAGSRGLVALTNVEIADAAVLETGDRAAASITDAIRQREQRLFDHVVRIGRLTAKERVLNLLLELHDRLDAVGLVKENSFRLPLTQEVFADALGLSVVHINRTLQQLRSEGMLTVGRGMVTLHQLHKLAAVACYQSASERVGLERQPRRAGGVRD
ncbi:Crp/Fnr family transcriptional regulator [Phenylobacterium sp. LjRoot225]|uniref:Crp/Fnr family transcriptional regulator n=1 Tax=Phenylobacterium sp. LjRoot225 TaxID=3342285 RepID=UPI003ECDA252